MLYFVLNTAARHSPARRSAWNRIAITTRAQPASYSEELSRAS
jgi:hypothetical protein